MKKWPIITILLLLLVAAAILIIQSRATPVPARHVQLAITGPSGQHFSGTYIADGMTNTLNTTVPTIINCWARSLTYEFKAADAREEFRVVLDVDEKHRTSYASYKGKSVKGGWRYSATEESAW